MNARKRLERSVRQAPPAATLSRVGLGAVILLAGAHKLVDPGAWSVYLAPAFARRWPRSVEATMVAFGVSELPFGLALLFDRYTAVAAAVVAVSTLGYWATWRSSSPRPAAAGTCWCGTWRC